MSKTRKITLTILTLIAAMCLAVSVSACSETQAVVAFDTMGGAAIESVTLDIGSNYSLPTSAQRTGYRFDGWYLSADYSGNPVTAYTVEEGGKTFYAKWTAVYALTLDVAGGTVNGSSQNVTINLTEGQNVYDAAAAYVPAKSGYQFGAWFKGNAELSKNERMPASQLTLTAKYKTQYVVEVYEQKTDKSGYEKTTETGYAYAGTTYNSEKRIQGFKEVRKEDTVTSITVVDGGANVLRHYFDREEYKLTFDSNYSTFVEGVENETLTTTVVYGGNADAPLDGFNLEGYVLKGWATTRNGAVAYGVNFLESHLYDGAAAVVTDKISPERNTTLYAVWQKGYVDMFGGNDYIFYEGTGVDIYLGRGGLYFKGRYNARSGQFSFTNAQEDVVLEGKLNEDYSFCYSLEARAETDKTLYTVEEGFVESVKLHFDKFNGVTYYEIAENSQTVESKGTYLAEDGGVYIATYTEGPLAGTSMVFALGTATNEKGNTEEVFRIRNEEEYALGEIYRFVTNAGSLTYYTAAYTITLSGFGTATYFNGSTKSSYYYTRDAETGYYTLTTSSGSVFGVIKISTETIFNNDVITGYYIYTESLDVTYEGANGSTLTLDGFVTAKYSDGQNEVEGYYALTSSAFGGYVVTIYAGNAQYKYLATTNTYSVEEEVLGENGETEKQTNSVTENKFETKGLSYAEYYYKDANGIYYAPLFVIENGTEAYLYSYTKADGYKKVVKGTYAQNEKGLYVFTPAEFYEEAGETVVADLKQLVSVTLDLGTATANSTSYPVNYWHEYTYNFVPAEGEEGEAGEKTESLVTVYQSGGDKLTVVGGFGIYEKNGNVFKGELATSNGYTYINTANGYFYFNVNEEDGTFAEVESLPFTAYVLTEGYISYANNDVYSTITFDGKGGATYTIYQKGEDGEVDTSLTPEKIEGSYQKTTETTLRGFYIYTFTSNDESLSFRFFMFQPQNSSNYFVYLENENYGGEYMSVGSGVLTIDGFGYYGEYVNSEGEKFIGLYYVDEQENCVVLIASAAERLFYFDLNDNGFTVRGKEYGTYIYFNNSGANGLYLKLDGYGKLTVFTIEKDGEGESETVNIDENGSCVVEGGLVTITYNDGGAQIVKEGELSTYEYNGTKFNTFVVKHDEVATYYVDGSDWSVLTLDAFGKAVRYDERGNREEGTYTLITSDMLYFVLEDGTDACIYRYNVNKRTAKQSKFKAKGYYTGDLDSLLFSKYGFAIFNNETRYYYDVVGGVAYIYRQDAENAAANEYGFVEETFGAFDSTVLYNGKTYYANDGFDIRFTREADSAEKYPVLYNVVNGEEIYYTLEDLVFSPTGDTEFSVSASVLMDNGQKTVTGKITREYVGEEFVTYITLANYRFYIRVDYRGEDAAGNSLNTYVVYKMELVRSYNAYNYINAFYYAYMYYYYFGVDSLSSLTNEYGTLTLVVPYNEEGVALEEEKYVNVTLGSAYGMADEDGNPYKLEHAQYLVEEDTGFLYIDYEEDGYEYRMYFGMAQHSAFKSYGFYFAKVRRQTLVIDGYTLLVERSLAGDVTVGGYFRTELTKGEEVVEATATYNVDGKVYYVVRETEDETEKVTASTYYVLTMTEVDAEQVGGEEEESQSVRPLATFEVKVMNMNVFYSAESETLYIEISTENEITFLPIGSYLYLVKTTEYDSETGKYTVELYSGEKYEITIDEDNKFTATQILEEATEETEEGEEGGEN